MYLDVGTNHLLNCWHATTKQTHHTKQTHRDPTILFSCTTTSLAMLLHCGACVWPSREQVLFRTIVPRGRVMANARDVPPGAPHASIVTSNACMGDIMCTIDISYHASYPRFVSYHIMSRTTPHPVSLISSQHTIRSTYPCMPCGSIIIHYLHCTTLHQLHLVGMSTKQCDCPVIGISLHCKHLRNKKT